MVSGRRRMAELVVAVFGRSVACLTYPSLLTARFPATAFRLTRMRVYMCPMGILVQPNNTGPCTCFMAFSCSETAGPCDNSAWAMSLRLNSLSQPVNKNWVSVYGFWISRIQHSNRRNIVVSCYIPLCYLLFNSPSAELPTAIS
ncbi:hypothetical protein B0T20DRAFT_158190 [Sordaria brevicollis]|uniref:Uncharacterized protein n=1 Tax=Sordaria brevicollis TaxID=83679 RepID=A0AAE0UE82_SORBR|nr:hypothetical protein B0T20DRAFT_158190 [Sordaria brevicollis]